jgi:hypothetical protein
MVAPLKPPFRTLDASKKAIERDVGMKIQKLIDIPDIKTPVAPNEFTASAKYADKNSLVVKFDERFPIDAQMPIQPKNMKQNPAIVGKKESLADLTWLDWQLIHLAMEKALQDELIKRADMRRTNEYETRNRVANKAMSDELFQSRFRIFMTWISRFKLERMFEELGIRSLEDFKRKMHIFNHQADASHQVFINLLLRQLGMEPNHIPSPALMMKITGKDDLIVRMKIEDDRVRLIDLSEARLRMAQLQAAENFSQQQLSQQRLTNWTERLHEGPTLSQRKILGVK